MADTVAGAASARAPHGQPRHRDGPAPRRSWLLAGLLAETAVVVGLTWWLFPSLWSVLRAVVDIDQSGGSDRGVNLTEVANHPEVMWDRTVTVSGRVRDVLDPRTAMLGSDALFVGDALLVVGDTPLDRLRERPDAGAIEPDRVLQVTGQVRPFDRAAAAVRLGGSAAVARLEAYGGRSMLVATSVVVDPPSHPGPGDKEFAATTDGFDVGVTVFDLIAHPEEHLGESVVVSGEIEEHLLTPHLFVLGDQRLLVVSAEPRPDLFVEATAYVAGDVRRFDVAEIEAELGLDLADARVAPFAGKPVVVARSVELVA